MNQKHTDDLDDMGRAALRRELRKRLAVEPTNEPLRTAELRRAIRRLRQRATSGQRLVTDGGRATSDADTPHVLSLCDRTGNALVPWAEDGYDCVAVDVDGEERVRNVGEGTIHHVGADVREWVPDVETFAAGFAWPPCTDLAYSGARWFDEKGWERYGEALTLAGRCRDLLEEYVDGPWIIENPASRLQNFFGDPDYRFDPYEYDGYTSRDESYTKETWLWASDEFRMPEPDGIDSSKADDRIHTMSPSEDRAEKRSETPMGFARAVYLAQEFPEEYACQETVQPTLAEVRST